MSENESKSDCVALNHQLTRLWADIWSQADSNRQEQNRALGRMPFDVRQMREFVRIQHSLLRGHLHQLHDVCIYGIQDDNLSSIWWKNTSTSYEYRKWWNETNSPSSRSKSWPTWHKRQTKMIVSDCTVLKLYKSKGYTKNDDQHEFIKTTHLFDWV